MKDRIESIYQELADHTKEISGEMLKVSQNDEKTIIFIFSNLEDALIYISIQLFYRVVECNLEVHIGLPKTKTFIPFQLDQVKIEESVEIIKEILELCGWS